ncbi:MAG TPA: 4Fe-4S dicluster domain-containing protein [Bacillota bacterium]|nr:4Fe-4S dicluster domain-containing protein [Bacillota bacterium]
MAEDQRPKRLSRRGLLAGGAIGVAAVALSTAKLAAHAAPLPAQSDVIFPHPDMCIGCGTCEVACSEWHASQGLSAEPRIHIMRPLAGSVVPLAAVQPYAGGIGFQQLPCKQCPVPECWAVCPANAIRIDPKTGARYIDEAACIACGKCASACPYPVQGMSEASLQPMDIKRVTYDASRNKFVKCDLCMGRPGGPACIAACPVNMDVTAGRIKAPYGALELRRSDTATYKKIL